MTVPAPRRAGRLAVAVALYASAAAQADIVSTVPADAQVVWLGEVHDNPLHHERQADAVAAMRPSALVFEMLTPERAASPTEAVRRDADALGAALDWADSGWPDWSLYAPVFLAAPEAALYGAARPPEAVRRAVGEGALMVFGTNGARFGLDEPLSEAERATREAGQMAAHCDALPEAMLGGMVEAQRLRDADLADAALRALEDTGGPVAVIAGTGHVRTDWGAPALLAMAAPDVRQFAVGQVEGAPDPDAPFDAVLTARAPERGDPCAAFR